MMNGFIRLATVAVAASGLVASAGCVHGTGCRTGGGIGGGGDRYRNAVDPCWPERYNQAARAATLAPFQAQAVNGSVLDHTIWNYHFEPGTDRLVPAGLEKLDYLVRRRPAPPPLLYLQTARDIAYDADAPEKYADARRDLDQRRADAVQKYLAAQTASRPMAFQIQVLDPADPAIPGQHVVTAFRQMPGQYTPAIGMGGAGMGGGVGMGGAGMGGGVGVAR
jgi:hypothetical protein